MRKPVKAIKKALPQHIDPVINDKAKHAVDQLCKEPTQSCLWEIRNAGDAVQGTSPIESLNSQLGTGKPPKSSGTLYDSTYLYIASVVFRHNTRYKQKYICSLNRILTGRSTTNIISQLLQKASWPSIVNAKMKFEVTAGKTLLSRGFIVKDAKFRWTPELTAKLIDVLKQIANNPNIVEVQDVHYWISHYKFDGMIPVKQIKKKVIQLVQETEK